MILFLRFVFAVGAYLMIVVSATVGTDGKVPWPVGFGAGLLFGYVLGDVWDDFKRMVTHD